MMYANENGVDIHWGCGLQSYTVTAKRQPHRSKRCFVYEDPLKGDLIRMMPTTVFPYTHPMDGFAILVSYEIKVSFNPHNY